MLIDKVRVYKTSLGSFWSGTWLRIAGYPRIDLTKPEYNPIVTDSTTQSFETGVDTGIKLR